MISLISSSQHYHARNHAGGLCNLTSSCINHNCENLLSACVFGQRLFASDLYNYFTPRSMPELTFFGLIYKIKYIYVSSQGKKKKGKAAEEKVHAVYSIYEVRGTEKPGLGVLYFSECCCDGWSPKTTALDGGNVLWLGLQMYLRCCYSLINTDAALGLYLHFPPSILTKIHIFCSLISFPLSLQTLRSLPFL